MKPYEKFLTYGPERLSDTELLAILIRTGTKERSALQISEDILQKMQDHSVLALHALSLQELMEFPGIGEVKAVRLKCVLELAVRLSQTGKDRLMCNDPEAVAALYMERMRHLQRERVILLLLDAKLHLIREVILSIGTSSESLLSVRDIFSEALRGGAVRIILLHNHPGGDPTPSGQDRHITRRVYEAGNLVGVELVDHLIIGDGSYVSMKKTNCF